MKNKQPLLKELTWSQARNDVLRVNPALAKEIDNLSPDNSYTLIKVSYPWGQHILREGVLQLPNEQGQYVPITHTSIHSRLRENLIYNEKNMPLGVLLNHSFQLYFKANQRITPFMSMSPGQLFGIWVSLQDNQLSEYTGTSNIMSGARTLFMLPKISDVACYKKLKKQFNLRQQSPNNFQKQWELFVELANHTDFPTPWTMDVLYFSANWLENKTDSQWRLFRQFLLEYGWQSTLYLRNQVVFDLIFSCALASKNLKPNPYLADTVKHLYAIGQGIYPGFKVANDDMAAPVASLQQIFVDIYGLKYQPTLMQPAYLTHDPMQPVYYSLEVPTLMEFSPKSRKIRNKLDELREIKHIMDATLDYLLEGKFNIRDSPLYRLAKTISFTYCHSEVDSYNGITQLTKNLVECDKALMAEAQKYNVPFCDTSPFLRGCVRIAKKQ